MTPIGRGQAMFVWGYALLWFLVTDRIKLLAYRILEPVNNDTPPVERRPNDSVAVAANSCSYSIRMDTP